MAIWAGWRISQKESDLIPIGWIEGTATWLPAAIVSIMCRQEVSVDTQGNQHEGA